MHNLVADLIIEAFLDKVGKNQPGKALLVSFSKKINYNTEEGYRQYDLLIQAPMNYVGVFYRECWDVIPLEALVETDDGDTEATTDYTKGESPWQSLCYHDSGWREEGVQEFLRNHKKDILGFVSKPYFKVIDISCEQLPYK